MEVKWFSILVRNGEVFGNCVLVCGASAEAEMERVPFYTFFFPSALLILSVLKFIGIDLVIVFS